jgi:MarR family transcriptional regulator for hemolysin
MSRPSADQIRLDFALQNIGHLLRRFFRRRLRDMGLTIAGSRALSYLAANEGAVQRTLADLLEIQPITLARTLDALERDGLVERRHSPIDRRVWLLYLTPAGRKMRKRVDVLNEQMCAEVLAGVDAQVVAQTADLLETVQARLALLAPPKTGAAAAGGSADGRKRGRTPTAAIA